MRLPFIIAFALTAFGLVGTANAQEALSFTTDRGGFALLRNERPLPLQYELRSDDRSLVSDYLHSETGEGFILFAPVTDPDSQTTISVWQIHTEWPEAFQRPFGYKNGNAYGVSVAFHW